MPSSAPEALVSPNELVTPRSLDAETLRAALAKRLTYGQGLDPREASSRDLYYALTRLVRDRLMDRWLRTEAHRNQQDARRVCYVSMEFLLGRLLRSAVQALDVEEPVEQVLSDYSKQLEQVEEEELASALGSGGLGRLAACFLDSMATQELPAWGYGLRYRFGLFKQKITDGWQSEEPDDWLRWGNPWEVARPEEAVKVSFYGTVNVDHVHNGDVTYRWVDTEDVYAVPFDVPVPGFRNGTVNTLRLWSAYPLDSGLDLDIFHSGDFQHANRDQVRATVLTQVLYPAERTEAGKELRLKQQYLLASATLQDQIRRHLRTHPNLDTFADKVVLQLNDTHPAIAIPELLRILIDDHGYGWEQAFDIAQRVFAYTNHTLMPEALETWPFALLARLLPRQIQIIQEIDRRFAAHVRQVAPGDGELVARTALISHDHDRMVRMAHMSVVASHSVNGVAELHTKLLREGVLADFARLFPDRFNCKTNGITPRRWLLQANPELAALITQHIGDGWTRDLDQLRQLEPLADDAEFRAAFRAIKQANKAKLGAVILAKNGIQVDVESVFDTQIKRIHEYKRQLMLALWVVDSYLQALRDPSTLAVPRTVVVAGKAAADYTTAKLIIKLLNAIANQINGDRRLNGRLKLVFLEGYNVELAAQIIVGTDVSEQISTAGYEASGTGNMKFALNGAITLGTLDGANVEIKEEVGDDNIVIFGLTADEVRARREAGYHPRSIYEQDERIRAVIDALSGNLFCPEEPGLFHPLVDSLLGTDEYMLLADLPAYIEAQQKIAAAYQDPDTWTRAAILNVARMGKFSSDRTIKQYAEEIWDLQPLPTPGF